MIRIGTGADGARSLLLVSLVFLHGCTLVDLEPEPLAIFDLRAAPVPRSEPSTGPVVVAEPIALAPLSSDRIAVRGVDGGLGVLAGARWAGSGPRLVQDLLLRGLEDAGVAASVVRPGTGAAHDCRLGGDLRAFEYLPGDARVRVALRARLVCDGVAGQEASRIFEASAAVRGRGAVAVVRGFDAAFAELVPEVVRWVAVAGGRAAREEGGATRARTERRRR